MNRRISSQLIVFKGRRTRLEICLRHEKRLCNHTSRLYVPERIAFLDMCGLTEAYSTPKYVYAVQAAAQFSILF